MLVEYPNSHFLFLRFISTKNFSTPFSNSSTETFVGMSSCFIYYKIPWLNVIMSRMNPHSIVCLNVKELLAQSRRHIWSLSDSNGIRTQNHLVCKQTLNHLAKLANMIRLCCEYLSVRCIWLFVLIMSSTRFRVNPHSIFTRLLRNSLLETGAKSEVAVT